MIELRPYQKDAVAAIFRYFETSDGHPIICLPTASGKSVIQAEFIRQSLELWPDERFLLLSHVKELLTQNHDKLTKLGINASLYSAGLGKREIGQVTVAGIQSVFSKAHKMGDVSIIIVDECHLISKDHASMYRSFIGKLEQICPHVRVIGMSATPFRLDSGPLHKGSKRLFTDIAYSISIRDLIDQGYLSPLVTAATAHVNASKVKKRGGEYITGKLEEFMDKEELTSAAITEIEDLCQDRKSWLVFCVGVDHAIHVCASLAARGHSARVVVGTTDKKERQESLDAFKRGELKALVSVGVLTTGFDAPNTDALICLRPTMSPGLWIQMVGRGTRLFTGKENCLVLDFTDNTKRHGPIDQIVVDGEGEVVTPEMRECEECVQPIPPDKWPKCIHCGFIHGRPCPECEGLVPFGISECTTCGFVFDKVEREIRHNLEATTEAIISDGKPQLKQVSSWEFKLHKKEGKPDSVLVRYWCGLEAFNEWLCFDHGGYPASKATSWWWNREGGIAPLSTKEALERKGECKIPGSIMVRKEGKFWRIV